MEQSLKRVLDSLIENAGLTVGLNQQRAIECWDDVVGTTIAKNTFPEKVEHGIMTVKVATPAWRQELLFKKKHIIEKLNEIFGKQIIKDIRFI